jgi:hypothetical protein
MKVVVVKRIQRQAVAAREIEFVLHRAETISALFLPTNNNIWLI